MNNNKKSRDQIQTDALIVFTNLKTDLKKIRRGTICLSTGTGKSKIAIDFIKNNKHINDILITSPRSNLKENWKKELTKWGWEEWTDDMWIDKSVKNSEPRVVCIEIENIQTAYKWKNRHYDFIIADEIHTMMTPEYSLLFKNVKYNNLMGLTATHDITNKNDKILYYKKYAPVIYEYYDSAEDGLINKTNFFIVNHCLSDKDKVLINLKNNRFLKGEKSHYEYLTERIKKGQQLMMQQGSDNWFEDAGNWFWKGNGSKEQKFAAMMYLNSIKYRKDFLLNLSSTAKIAKKIKEVILMKEDTKVLIFSELTKQIETITKNTVHSNNKPEVNTKRMDDFNKGIIRDLGSCQSLTLGLNLVGATHAIMESYIGSGTKSMQKKGRLDRLATDDVANMWIIRVLDTQSEKWFDQMTKGLIDPDSSDVTEISSDKFLKYD